MSEEQRPEHVQISMIWPDIEALSVFRANQFMVQLNNGPDGLPEDLLLTTGYVAPPVILGTPEEQAASVRALGAVAVKTISRVSFSRGQAVALIDLLQRQVEQFDLQTGQQS